MSLARTISVLTTTAAVALTIAAARLLDAWPVIGPISGALAEGAARSVKAYLDDLEEVV
jgi:hypothetical protein